jgi:hypothetical protein
MNRINHLAVLVAAAAYWVLGGLWYSPLLFKDRFIALKEFTDQQVAVMTSQSHVSELVIAFVIGLITSYVLAYVIARMDGQTAFDGMKIAFMLCVGLILTTQLETVLFELRKPGLYLINNGYHVVAFLVMGAILGAWSKKSIAAPDLAYRKAAS